jgi:hypothetical protein
VPVAPPPEPLSGHDKEAEAPDEESKAQVVSLDAFRKKQ